MPKSVEIISEEISEKSSCINGLLRNDKQRCQFMLELYTGQNFWSLSILNKEKEWADIVDFFQLRYSKEDYANRTIINYLIANMEKLIVQSTFSEKGPVRCLSAVISIS